MFSSIVRRYITGADLEDLAFGLLHENVARAHNYVKWAELSPNYYFL